MKVFEKLFLKICKVSYTVKPPISGQPEQQTPQNNGQKVEVQNELLETPYGKTSQQRTPLISGHKYIVPIGHSWWKLPPSSGQAGKTKQKP